MVQKEMSFKDISYLELWQPLCSADKKYCAILAEGIMRNDSVKLFWILTSDLGGNAV